MNLEIYFNLRKIRYEILKEMINSKLDNKIKTISLYIDVNSILEDLYRPDIFDNLKLGSDKYTITVQLLNIVAHYRHFFYSRYGISTICYLVYNNEKSTYHTKIQNDYKKDYYSKIHSEDNKYFTVNRIIEKNVRILDLLCPYLPDTYFVNSLDFEPSVIPYYLIETDTEINNINIILTENDLMYQYVNLPSTFIIDTKRKKNMLVSKSNVWNNLTGKHDVNYQLSTEFISLYFSIIGKSKYNIDKIKGYAKIKTVNLIQKLIDNGDIINSKYNNIKEITDILISKTVISSEQSQQIVNNFNLLDYQLISKMLKTKHEYAINDSLIDKEDNENLKRINDTYFNNNPIMLIELTEGC